jgi:hypothetical protein
MKHAILNAVRKRVGALVVGTAAFLAIAVAWSLLGAAPGEPSLGATSSAGWGNEAVGQVRDQIAAMSPIAAANACGLGASSCFKCHNGTRAAAPGEDKVKNPWHPQHKSVNNSCAGCHKGNPRLLKKELAHANLIKDPRAQPETCNACHKGGNVAELLKQYGK